MLTPIVGAAYVAKTKAAANNRLVNLFPEINGGDSKTPAFLTRSPGLRRLLEVGEGPIRGIHAFGDSAYVVSGGELYRVTSAYGITFVGDVSIIGTISGFSMVSMADNGIQLLLVCEPDGYIYDTSDGTFTQLTLGANGWPDARNVCYLDGYFVVNVPDSRKVYVSDLYDGTTFNPLAFASAEGNTGNTVGIIANHRELWVFGERCIEVWYNAGQSPFPLLPIQGAFNEIGCLAANSIAKMDNSVFWLGRDDRGAGIVFRSNGFNAQRISNHSIEWIIQQYPTMVDVVAYTYQQDGHSFYIMNFPSADATWAYDIATDKWHERASFESGAFKRHRANCQCNFLDNLLFGDYEDGRIYTFDPDVYDDDGQVQKWLRSWRAFPEGQAPFTRTRHNRLTLDCEAGVGIDGDVQGSDPQIVLRFSDDGGFNWSNEIWRSMGKIGVKGNRIIFRPLGMTKGIRDRVYEISGTDPVAINIMGADLEVAACRT